MESLRWILIFAGVAILVALWFSGRTGRRDGIAARPDPLLGDGASGSASRDDGFGGFDAADPFARAPGAVAFDGGTAGRDDFGPVDFESVNFAANDFGDPDGTGLVAGTAGAAGAERPVAQTGATVGQGFGGLSAKLGSFGERLATHRRKRDPEPGIEMEMAESDGSPRASKIVMLHVVAPDGEFLPPEELRDMLERRGYHHGDMNIYHSLFRGESVFSVARMIEPGTFDVDDLATFETPGLALILQLPGPVEAGKAFDVMLTEASEMATELGAVVLDGDRSTLGRQTEQHMREGIHEFMHRQKYFDSVA